MKKLRNVLLSLLVISALSACNVAPVKDIILLPPRLSLPEEVSDAELGCVNINTYASIRIRDGLMVERIITLSKQIEAHNAKNN